MKIRKAVLKDAPGIAKVHVDSWRTTYKEIIPGSYLNDLSYEERTGMWNRVLKEERGNVIVAEGEDGGIAGFASRNGKDDSCDLTAIYLLEEFQGRGIGKMMFEKLFKHFKEVGYGKIYVEVLEDNKTRRFYEYYGAKLTDTVEIQIGGEIFNELIYEWDDVDEVIGKLHK
ncbi:GNAT family N-acetyltransferase [Salinicoccus roseus]|uniref:GNAT family N-acetyltransferase n=1 Tax=Salinicoccus roseus TaxID=45670 RepID=UPI000F4F69A6|nr:GNAT family N-acetyltransferase [Salinicoccus roseus]RPE54509.1 L-amino acid N-acyltransferase YncA [Salinicoccus roseus]GGA64981.1 putative N-acetyltransferase YuaI [Salinicoccus roseus]